MPGPQIASFTGFTGWTGRLHLSTRSMAKLPKRPGVTKAAWVMDTWETNPEDIITSIPVADASTAVALLNSYRRLQDGATKTVTDPLNRQWSVKVVKVTGETSQKPNGSGLRLVARWTFSVEADEPI